MKNKQYKIGLALSGGGARGFAHLGVLMALEKFGLKPNIISGVSAGAIVAILYGSGLTATDIFKYFAEFDKISKYAEFTIPKKSIFKLDKMAELLQRILPIQNIEETKIPTIICATDFDNGKSIGWAKGEIIPRIIASCSIPVIFPPVNINGINYVDGGVLRNLPAWAIRDKCKTLIGSNCSPLSRDYHFKSSIIDVATRSFQLMAKANTLQDLLICDHVIQSSTMANYGAFDINSMKNITMCGYESACKVLDKIKK